jgi:acyl carrier protein
MRARCPGAASSPSSSAGWDSFKQIEIVMATEERFAIKLHTRELDRLHNVGDLVAVIAAKVAKS